MITLGQPVDPKGREVTVEVNLGEAAPLFVVSPDKTTIKLKDEVGVLGTEHIGIFEINVKLSSSVDDTETSKYYKVVVVVAKEAASLASLKKAVKGDSETKQVIKKKGRDGETTLNIMDQGINLVKDFNGFASKVPLLKAEEVEILKTPVSELTKEMAFESVPIEARLVLGVDYFKEIVARQKEYQAEVAAESLEDTFEMRISKLDNGGTLKMSFSKTLELPENVKDLVN